MDTGLRIHPELLGRGCGAPQACVDTRGKQWTTLKLQCRFLHI